MVYLLIHRFIMTVVSTHYRFVLIWHLVFIKPKLMQVKLMVKNLTIMSLLILLNQKNEYRFSVLLKSVILLYANPILWNDLLFQ